MTTLKGDDTLMSVVTTDHNMTRRPRHRFTVFKHITSISPIPLHYQLNKNFSMQTRRQADPPSETESPSPSSKTQPHIIHNSVKPPNRVEKEKATPRKRASIKQKHQTQTSFPEEVFSPITPLAEPCKCKTYQSPHRSRFPS